MSTFIPAPVKPLVSMATLESIDIRLGTIQRVDEIASSRKLIKLMVGFGDRTRQVIAGLRRERENVSALVGQQALFVVNLEPRTMAGEVSEAMLFDIGYADGLPPALAVPERALPDGARAG
jgi:tRNA-binding protein